MIQRLSLNKRILSNFKSIGVFKPTLPSYWRKEWDDQAKPPYNRSPAEQYLPREPQANDVIGAYSARKTSEAPRRIFSEVPDEPLLAPPICGCNLEAVRRRVRRQNVNYGRAFWTCAQNPENSTHCGFFLWDGPAHFYQKVKPRMLTDRKWSTDTVMPGTHCDCGVPGRMRVVLKESSNKGKTYMTCGMERSDGCDFFAWVDSTQLPRTY